MRPLEREDFKKLTKSQIVESHLELQEQIGKLRRQILSLRAQITRARSEREMARKLWGSWKFKALRERKGKMSPRNIEKALTHALRENGYRVPTALPLSLVVDAFLEELERIYTEAHLES